MRVKEIITCGICNTTFYNTDQTVMCPSCAKRIEQYSATNRKLRQQRNFLLKEVGKLLKEPIKILFIKDCSVDEVNEKIQGWASTVVNQATKMQ